MKALTSLKFRQIQPQTAELAFLELLKTSSPKGNDRSSESQQVKSSKYSE